MRIIKYLGDEKPKYHLHTQQAKQKNQTLRKFYNDREIELQTSRFLIEQDALERKKLGIISQMIGVKRAKMSKPGIRKAGSTHIIFDRSDRSNGKSALST